MYVKSFDAYFIHKICGGALRQILFFMIWDGCLEFRPQVGCFPHWVATHIQRRLPVAIALARHDREAPLGPIAQT
jgi:hypothetical protein